jgi:predicted metal-dependent hydrolase
MKMKDTLHPLAYASGFLLVFIKLEVKRLMLKWQETIGVTINSWQVKSMKTRWGSCNDQKRAILINLELFKKPINCLEYIVVHELVHLFERKHNQRFVNYMDKFMPNWRFHKNELNRTTLSYINWNY